jgi:hypothetical protein
MKAQMIDPRGWVAEWPGSDTWLPVIGWKEGNRQVVKSGIYAICLTGSAVVVHEGPVLLKYNPDYWQACIEQWSNLGL